MPAPERADAVFASFVVNHFPRNVGLVGLLLAAILAAAMSTLSSSLNASASALVHDFLVRPAGREAARSGPQRPESMLLVSRGLTVAFGLVQIGVGLAAARLDETVIRAALAIAGVAAGLLLGVFSLGTMTRRVGTTAALVGGGCGLLTLLTVQFLLPVRGIVVAFPWYAMIGASTTFLAGLLASLVWRRPDQVSTLEIADA